MLAAWATEHWFELLQSVGIVAGILFTRVALKTDAKTRRVENLLKIAEQHRSIWATLFERPELIRILKPDVDLSREPVTDNESLFVRQLILHLSLSFHATRQGLFLRPERLRDDVRAFFTLPIPGALWKQWRVMQDEAFIAFVEECLR